MSHVVCMYGGGQRLGLHGSVIFWSPLPDSPQFCQQLLKLALFPTLVEDGGTLRSFLAS